MNYDFALFVGHGDGDPGATNKNFNEHDIAQHIVNVAKSYLDNTNKKILYGVNNYKNKLLAGATIESKSALSVHLNSAGDVTAKGTEIWAPARESFLKYDFTLVENISKIINTNNRSVRSKNYDESKGWNYRNTGYSLNYTDWMSEVRDAWSRGISLSLLEVGFISNTNEAQTIVNNINRIGREVAIYACSCMGISVPEFPKQKEKLYRVQVGAYKQKQNAEALVQDLKQKGYNSIIVEVDL